ncbi:ATP-binding cassette transporter snq2, partial [Marasmius crinis-equi]
MSTSRESLLAGNASSNNSRGSLEEKLKTVVQRLDEADIKIRELGVVFEDLRVEGLGASSSFQPTVGSLLNPYTYLESFARWRHPSTRYILDGFEGVVKPGEMLLVLGRPGSGCSTLLKTLANQREEYHAIGGNVHYDSFTPQEIHKQYRGDVLYCPEDDLHFPTLTVEQTIRFAAMMRAPAHRLGHSLEEYVQAVTDTLLETFGLEHVRNTLVGDAAIRGVSGGEKKRVSISEVLATRARIISWDNATRGLDASTALEFVQALRTFTDIARMTTIVSLYQAGESLYNLFDKVCVIYDGKLAYLGPTSEARSYFISMGYLPAPRQTTADFLVAVTDPYGRIPEPSMHLIPKTADDFAYHFRNSKRHTLNKADVLAYKKRYVGQEEIKAAYRVAVDREHDEFARVGSPYLVSGWKQAKAVVVRRIQMLKGDWLAAALNSFSFVVIAAIAGTMYFKVPNTTEAFYSRGGVLFFSLIFSALVSMSEIPALFAQRPIVLRHMKFALHHPWIDQAALFLVDFPITLLQLTAFSVMVYELVQLQQSFGQFLVFLIIIVSVALAMKGWFRAVSAAFITEAPAQSLAGVSVIAFALYAGYMLPKESMVRGLHWITYVNPLRYGFDTLMVNEFRTLEGKCDNLIPHGPGYEGVDISNQVCPTAGAIPGNATVDGYAFLGMSVHGFRRIHIWGGFIIIVVFNVLFVSAALFFTEINARTPADQGVIMFKRKRSTVEAISKSKRTMKSKVLDEENDVGVHMAEDGIPLESLERDAPGSNPQFETRDCLSWHDVSYTVPVSRGTRTLLMNVSGYVVPGKLTALMGESGAGKTTLLNVLAQRTSVGVVKGDIFVNGQSLPKDFGTQTYGSLCLLSYTTDVLTLLFNSGFCQQTDTHLGTATVREALLFSATLRQPSSVPSAEKQEYVDKCLKICGLWRFKDAIIGTLNAENRKRTTIAVELAAKPKLLVFLDEPTSGLDSRSAWAIIAFLRDLAANGQAILCTYKWPELFQVFDRLLLLKKGGETVYFGDLGPSASTLINYFERNGSRACLPEENPAEFILDVIGAGATAQSTENWHTIWVGSPERQKIEKDIQQIHTEGESRPPFTVTLKGQFAASWSRQTWELLKRNHQSYYRDPTYITSKLLLSLFAAIFVGFSYFRSRDDQLGTQNKLFAIFMATVISIPLVDQLVVVSINMRSIYEIRERGSRTYSWTAFVTSQLLVELPWNMLGSTLFFLCWYWAVGFPSDRAGYTYLMLGVIFPVYYTTLGQSVAAMSPDAEIANILFSFIFTFVLTFNGVFQPYSQLGWWRWLYHIVPYTYFIEGLLGQ